MDRPGIRLLLGGLGGREETILDVDAVRKAGARPSEPSRQRLVELALDPHLNSDPRLRAELARALHAHQSARIESSTTLALLNLLDHNAKGDPAGMEALAREVAAMVLRRSPDPLAHHALQARARDAESTLARAAARKALGLPSALPTQPAQGTSRPARAAKTDQDRPTSELMREFAEGREDAARELARRSLGRIIDEASGSRGPRLDTVLAWLHGDSARLRRITCEGLALRLKESLPHQDSVWIVGALAERYRIEPSAHVRRSLIAALSSAAASPTRTTTLALAADLDSDAAVRDGAREAMQKG